VALRNFSSVAAKATLTAGVTSGATSLPVSTTSGWPSVPFTLLIDRGKSTEEVVTATAISGLNITVTRGEDGSSAVTHSPGAAVEHGVSARDYSDANTVANMVLTPGTTGARPATPPNGSLRYNTTTSKLEVYVSPSWVAVGP
jgi:hypothetical protein